MDHEAIEQAAGRAGLYDPRFEHDACGVGFVCRVDGAPTHDIVRLGLSLLSNLDHRGARGSDPNTGDGAGVTIQVPHALMAAAAREWFIALPSAGDYGVGLVFLPGDKKTRARCREAVEKTIRAEGLRLLGWREVPTRPDAIGESARASMPAIWHVFVGKGPVEMDGPSFERKLYVVRKSVERFVWSMPWRGSEDFHIASISAQTLVYKGMLTARQLGVFYKDLTDSLTESALAMVHSRFSTNTFPSWSLAQPFRFLCHNGEINTLRGNENWMRAREGLFKSERFGPDLEKVLPVLNERSSDSGKLDNALELLHHTGRSLPHALMMMMPEAWEQNESMPDELRAFYEYHACLMEPWDGPATVPFTDGRYIGAALDRNGLRPARYTITGDGLVVLASESGAIDVDPAHIASKGRLQPGKMLLVDLVEHRIISDDEIKLQIARRRPYRSWLNEEVRFLEDLPHTEDPPQQVFEDLRTLQNAFGYTDEAVTKIIDPMGVDAKEALGSMGDDTPLAVLSDNPRLLYDYFRQLFAQVTNPPLDAIREEMVTSLLTNLGGARDLFQETPEHCRVVRLKGPILTEADLQKVRSLRDDGLSAVTIPSLFNVHLGTEALPTALADLCEAARTAIQEGNTTLILSDRGVDGNYAPIPALLATAAVHHFLIRESLRTKAALVVESGEPHEVHHFALLLGYGAEAICPYLALETASARSEDRETSRNNFVRAIEDGILKAMSKMGISTIQSYCGAQVFEAIGIAKEAIAKYFTGTPSRVGGIGLDVIAIEARLRHQRAYQSSSGSDELAVGGRYEWRRNGERHAYDPLTISRLQDAARRNRFESYEEFSRLVNERSERPVSLRNLLEFDVNQGTSVPIEEVEPWTSIVTRFKTGAMSYGSISRETHETLAAAMNAIGGKSNTGEGGEDPDRYDRESATRSRIKQVASGRFGVTIGYLSSADEIQIKMAQGAKPGEGGQLPGEKVFPWIAKTRHATPYVGLISPPPHHDIYSIEDLAQLIHDLKNANPGARISVKLVSECGVGTIAAGVAKGKADVILISGHDGGTGASPKTSLAHAGLPWELGLAETHQTLVLNGLRSRVKLECDGQLKTGRDVAIACLLGADEFGFATAPLVALGCIMMRKCHLNTCPVGIATQNPALRKHFTGKPEHVINYLRFVAEELRGIMAELGFRSIDEMVGRVEHLRVRDRVEHWKASHLDLSRLLHPAHIPGILVDFRTNGQVHNAVSALDRQLVSEIIPRLTELGTADFEAEIRNTDRTVGTTLSAELTNRFGENAVADDAVSLRFRGCAGQSFMAFGAKGISARLEGDANDYCGKGLSGARLVIVPPPTARFEPEKNIIVGNVAFYGATSGEAFIRGQAGERFCVRNSGLNSVVEGVGDHGCEYMTGGRVVVLGPTGRNFAAGMSGGIAYVLDGTQDFRSGRCNLESVELLQLDLADDVAELRHLVETHRDLTGSAVAAWVLDNWEVALQQFVKVMPVEYRKALVRLEQEETDSKTAEHIAA
ncbi:MAG TPA: glutamate synthase large subunit [Rhodothermales bacterium]